MKARYQRWTKQEQAPAGDAGGAAAGTPAGAPAPAAGTPSPAPAPAGSILSSGADEMGWLPEKFRTNGADGKLDMGASARKLAESYAHLEKRGGSQAPAAVTDYKLSIPDDLKDALKDWNQAEDTELQAFLADAHKAGMSQAQIDVVFGKYLPMLPKLARFRTPEQQTEDARTELGKHWKTPQEFEKGTAAAYRAASAFVKRAGMTMEEFDAAVGNNPTTLRLLAAIAPELGEDTPVQGQPLGEQDFEAKKNELMAQRSELKPNDPRRKEIQRQLDELYAKQYPEPR